MLDEIRPMLIADGGNVAIVNIDKTTRNIKLLLQGRFIKIKFFICIYHILNIVYSHEHCFNIFHSFIQSAVIVTYFRSSIILVVII